MAETERLKRELQNNTELTKEIQIIAHAGKWIAVTIAFVASMKELVLALKDFFNLFW